MPSRMKLAKIVADGGVDDRLVLDDSLATQFHSLVFGQNPKLPRVCLTQCLDLKHQSNQMRFI